MHDVADKVGDAALVGAIAAAIAALALACRTRGPKLEQRPVGFPRDPNATLAKYENAYLQLVSKSAEQPLQNSEPSTALDYALLAFEQAKGASSMSQNKEKPAAQSAPDFPLKPPKPGKGGK
ncbi:MAG TPA: hypothetical protein V6C89_16415 [Drouetiella sp.]